MNEILKCKFCKFAYDSNNRLPLIIKCGHSFCRDCVLNRNFDDSCPICQKEFIINIEDCVVNFLVEEVIYYIEREKLRREDESAYDENKRFFEESSPVQRRLTSIKDVIPIKFNEKTRSNSLNKNFGSETTRSNEQIYENRSPSTQNQIYTSTHANNRNESINEKSEEDYTIDTIPLPDDKSIFDHSFRDDFQELISSKPPTNSNYNMIPIKPIISSGDVIGANSPRNSNSVNASTCFIEEISKTLREDLYKTVSDPVKRRKYEDYLKKALESSVLANQNNRLITYQLSNEEFYVGNIEKNKLCKGIIFYENGDYYEGEFFNDKKDGYGILIFKNGTKYEGMFKLNRQHGYGKLFQCDGEVYMGEWKEGKINGNGVRYHSNGDKYSGQYINNIRHGNGSYIFANGDHYEGDWINGKATGKGKFIYANGNFYEGEFVDNQICGKGSFTTFNGDFYKGNFKNGLLNGNGIYKSFKGETYQGEFVNGKKNGYGNLFSPEGNLICSGYWNKDVYIGK